MNGRTNSAGGTLASDMEIPLDPCTDFVGVRIKDLEYLGKVRLTWTDPKDKYATPEGEAMEDTDQLVSKWSYTQIVRQADRAPVNPSDGVTVCTETTRNQYQTTGFIDTTAESNVTYYYGAYAFNEDGVYSEVISNGVQPVSFSTTLADNTWEEIDQACTLGLAESLWEIGDEKTFMYSNGMVDKPAIGIIIAFNHDNLSDDSGKAVITFTIKDIVDWKTDSPSSADDQGYDKDFGNVFDSITDSELVSVLKSVKKLHFHYETGVTLSYINQSSIQYNTKLFAFNIKELNYAPVDNDGLTELTSVIPYPYFMISSNRTLSYHAWTSTQWGSGNYNDYGYWYLHQDGYVIFEKSDSNGDFHSYYIRPGFCIGKVAV